MLERGEFGGILTDHKSGIPELDRLDLLDDRSHDELIALILRGHLLIEQQLTEIIARTARSPMALQQARLRFSQLLYVAKALFYDERDDDVWSSIQKLNRIRNRLAHSPNVPEVYQMVRDFLLLPNGPNCSEGNIIMGFHRSLGYLTGALGHISDSARTKASSRPP